MKAFVFLLVLATGSSAFAQYPLNQPLVRPLVRPLVGPNAAAYPQQYSYPRRKAWSQQDRALNIWQQENDILYRGLQMQHSTYGNGMFMDATPYPWQYPHLFR